MFKNENLLNKFFEGRENICYFKTQKSLHCKELGNNNNNKIIQLDLHGQSRKYQHEPKVYTLQRTPRVSIAKSC